VIVGDKVRVLEIAKALTERVPPDEWQELQAMVGEIFRVYEIDEYGAAWVETSPFRKEDGCLHNHSLGLDPHEMEVVSQRRPESIGARSQTKTPPPSARGWGR
jgi:hypothetical protein